MLSTLDPSSRCVFFYTQVQILLGTPVSSFSRLDLQIDNQHMKSLATTAYTSALYLPLSHWIHIPISVL